MRIGLGTLDLAQYLGPPPLDIWIGLTLGSILGHGSRFCDVQGLGTRVVMIGEFYSVQTM